MFELNGTFSQDCDDAFNSRKEIINIWDVAKLN